MDGWTSIAVTNDTHDELEKRGKKRESYNNIIRRFLGLEPEVKSKEES